MLLRAHNEERRKEGVAPLSMHPGLTEAARCHSKDMIEKEYFSHTSKDGTEAGERVKRLYG